MIKGPPLKPVPQMPCVGEIPRFWARQGPDRVAIMVPELGVSWTYAELADRVGRALAILRDQGLGPGDRIAYLGRNSDFYFVLLFAAIRGGLILVALNWRSAPAEIDYFLSDCTPQVVFCDAEFRPTVEAARKGDRPWIIETERGSGAENLRAMLDEDGPIDPTAVDGHGIEEAVLREKLGRCSIVGVGIGVGRVVLRKRDDMLTASERVEAPLLKGLSGSDGELRDGFMIARPEESRLDTDVHINSPSRA